MKRNKEDLQKVIKEDVREVDGIVYTYKLIESSPKTIGRLTVSFYSIKIEMCRGEESNESMLSEIFADVGKALTFYNSLVEHLASPIDLHYILEDKISL